MAGPCERSMALMRKRGFAVAKSEYWNPHAGRRIDLFTILDLVCLPAAGGYTVGVQSTTAPHISSRIAKIAEAEATPLLLKCGWRILVQGWRKKGGLWECREVEFTEAMLRAKVGSVLPIGVPAGDTESMEDIGF